MALAPKGRGKDFRDSVRVSAQTALPGQEYRPGYHPNSGIDWARFEVLAKEFAEKNAEQAALDKKREAMELVAWELWAAKASRDASAITIKASTTDPFAVVEEVRAGWEKDFEGTDPDKLYELEERLKAYERGGSIVRIRRRGGNVKLDHDPFEEADIEKIIGWVLTPHIIEKPGKFTKALHTLRSYLAWAKRERAEFFSGSRVQSAEHIAKLILPFYNSYMNNSGRAMPDGSKERFLMLFSDITRAVPGVVHKLNILQLQQAVYQDGFRPGAAVQPNGSDTVSGNHKQHYINHPRNGSHAQHNISPIKASPANVAISREIPRGTVGVTLKYNPVTGMF